MQEGMSFDSVYQRLQAAEVSKAKSVLGRLGALKGIGAKTQRVATPVLQTMTEYAAGPMSRRELTAQDLTKIRFVRKQMERFPGAMEVPAIAARVLQLKEVEIGLQMPVSKALADIVESEPALGESEYAYLVTNETGADGTLAAMERRETVGNLMLGVSGLHSLDLFVQTDLTALVVVDVAPQTERLWSIVGEVVAAADDHKQALSMLKEQVISQQPDLFVDLPTMKANEVIAAQLKGLDANVAGGGSWLSTEEGFQKVKKLFAEGNFAFKRIDLCDPEKLGQLQAALEASGHQLDVAYLSNVGEYAEKLGGAPGFKAGMQQLAQSMEGGAIINSEHLRGVPRQTMMDSKLFLATLQ